MQCDLGMVDETLEKLVKKIDIKITYPRTRILNVIFKTRASGKINNYTRQGLIQWDIGMSVAPDPAFIA